MVAILIFAISVLTLLQFFVSYCHSLIAKSRLQGLSDHVREIAGVTMNTIRGDQFKRLLRLIALCPEPEGGKHEVHAVEVYFSMLGFARTVLRLVFPAAVKWIEAERSGCAYAAAVMLDRRIAYSRTLLAQRAGSLG